MMNFFRKKHHLDQDEQEQDLDFFNLDEMDMKEIEPEELESEELELDSLESEELELEELDLEELDVSELNLERGDADGAAEFYEEASDLQELELTEINLDDFEEDGIEYIDMDAEESLLEEEDAEPVKRRNSKKRKGGFFSRFGTMDKIVAATGAIVLVVAILTVSIYTSAKAADMQVAAFAPIGEQLASFGVIGEDTLLAVADEKLASAGVIAVGYESTDYEEEEYSGDVYLAMTLTSVVKDLKIKFVNDKTSKLIANVPFEVTITYEDDTTITATDEDEDGIIYLSDMESGKVTVELSEVVGMEDMIYSLDAETVTIKETADYEVIDVTDEILDESQVDTSVEDTQVGTDVESTLTDTVTWVESTQTLITSSDTYTVIDKSTISDPSLTSLLTFLKLSSIPVTGVSLSDTSLALTVGGTSTLTATVSPDNATNKNVEWTTSDSTIASVSNGVVTANSAGTATITVTTEEGSVTATCTVTVSAVEDTTVAVTSVSLSSNTLSLDVGKTSTLTTTVSPSGATNSSVSWSSSDEAVASVSGGTVTAIAAGKATITATTTDGNKTATCEVTVTAANVSVTGVTLSSSSVSLAVDGTSTLTPTIEPSNATNTGVTWSSSSTSVATVSSSGAVTGVAAGTATITATTSDGSKTATCTVTVTAATVSVTGVTLSSSSLSVAVGGTSTLTATIAPTTATDTSVTWSSSSTSVASVSATGVVTGVATGTATITVTTTDGSKTATCAVTVTSSASSDTTSLLKNNDGEQVYYKDSDGNYCEAKYADYYLYDTFYMKSTTGSYKYTGWQVIDGKTYFFDSDGNKVTGEQVIQGAQYTFASDGSLNVSSGTSGIDVSKWNGTIDWTSVKNSGVSYVIIRCGYRGSTSGGLIEDPMFKTNIQGAINAGLKVGVYFFSQAINETEAIEEASMTISLIKNYAISYPVFLDVEASGGRADSISSSTRTSVIKAYCETIKNSGYTAGVYANKNWLETMMDASSLSSYKIWLAQYATTPTYGGKYDLWQYSKSGSVTGISGNVDLNISYLGY
ncbi:MAG: Ig-like domain-containing protein [Eubacteriales bacterium]